MSDIRYALSQYTEDEIDFIENFCKDDYLTKHNPSGITEKITITLCKHCNKIKAGKSWQEDNLETIEQQVLAKTKPEMMIQGHQGQKTDKKYK